MKPMKKTPFKNMESSQDNKNNQCNSSANGYLSETSQTIDTTIEDQLEETKKEPSTTALETVYFRTFQKRPLLDREEELRLAKEIDESSQSIRGALVQAIQLMKHLANKPHFKKSIKSLTETHELSGFSSPSLDEAYEVLS